MPVAALRRFMNLFRTKTPNLETVKIIYQEGKETTKEELKSYRKEYILKKMGLKKKEAPPPQSYDDLFSLLYQETCRSPETSPSIQEISPSQENVTSPFLSAIATVMVVSYLVLFFCNSCEGKRRCKEPNRCGGTIVTLACYPSSTGLVDPSELLANIESQINRIKDEAQSRKEIIDRIDRWLSACEEENWLEEYNHDENRYSAGRGGHVNLQHAEQARITVNKIPSMVDNLIKKTLLWEDETQKSFLYDGVRLVSILEDYKLTRKQQEEEKKRYRDQKKRQDLILNRRESIYGSKPSPRRRNSVKRSNGYNGNVSMPPTPRRNSSGTTNTDIMTPRSYSSHRQNGYFKEVRRLPTAPLNFVAIPKEDSVSTYTSVCGSEPDSLLHN